MIAGLRGIVHSKGTDQVVIDVNGVRYACMVSLTTLGKIGEPGEKVELVVHTHVREDALQLFGFSSERERRVFLALISVSGIGPKLAQNMLSGASADELGRAVVSADLHHLTAIPGIGKKTAERIVLELRERLMKILALTPDEAKPAARFDVEDELVSALLNLGYKEKHVWKTVEKLANRYTPDAGVEELIRSALREMRS